MFSDQLESALTEAKKFKVGDIVRRTKKAMKSMGITSGPINGKVVGYSGRFVQIVWSDDKSEEPMSAAEAGIELDKRAMAKRSEEVEDLSEMDLGTERGASLPGGNGYTLPGGSGDARQGYGSVPDPKGSENSQAALQAGAIAQASAVFSGLYQMGPGDKVRIKGEVYTAQSSVQMGPQRNWLTISGPKGQQFMLMVPSRDATQDKPAEWMTLMQTGRATTNPTDIKTADIYAENIGETWLDKIEEGLDLREGSDPLSWLKKQHGKYDIKMDKTASGGYVPTASVLANRERSRQGGEIDVLGHSMFGNQYASEPEGDKGVWITYRDNRDKEVWASKMMELISALEKRGYKVSYKEKGGKLVYGKTVVMFDQKKAKATQAAHSGYVKWLASQGSKAAGKSLGEDIDHLSEGSALPPDSAKEHGIKAVVGSKIVPGQLVKKTDEDLYGIFLGWNMKSGTINVVWFHKGRAHPMDLKKAIKMTEGVVEVSMAGWDEGGWNLTEGITDTTIRQIANMTNKNDHTGALVALAKAINAKPMLQALEAMKIISNFYGHMPHGLIQVRDDMSKQLMRYASQELDRETYDQLSKSF